MVAYSNCGIGTSEGIRFKSAKTRGGFVEDVLIRDLKMENVPLPFTFNLDWNSAFSYVNLPPDLKDPPAHWVVLGTHVMPLERGLCEFRNITIENVEITGARQIFSAAGLPERLISNVSWTNVTAQGKGAGSIAHARNWAMTNVRLQTVDGLPVKMADNTNVNQPQVSKQ